MAFLNALLSERIKLRRSLLGWLILCGGLFVPTIMFAVRMRRLQQLSVLHQAGVYWQRHWMESWESISIMILPLMVALIATLILQVEYKNNTWKQVHTSPQSWGTIFSAKLAMAFWALLQLFLVLNAGLYLAGALPSLFARGTGPLSSPIPFAFLVKLNTSCFVDCLPILALEFLLALRFRNFLVPVGVGAGGWILSLVLINTPYNFVVPYNYTGIDYLITAGHRTGSNLPASLLVLSLGTFTVFTAVSYILYARHKDKG
ncbi:MAG TPA: ABC transporter permease [Holophagaceae bacterium]|jgi:hypothetical protein|nr:ABC transporter permease [Holophagaceae bacterium]